MQKLLIICIILYFIPVLSALPEWERFKRSHRNQNAGGVMRIPVYSFYNTMFCGQVTMGGEEEIFLKVYFDTSSSDFWLPSSDCDQKSAWCRKHERYNHRESRTYKDAHRNFTATFGQNIVNGRVSIDQVVLGDVVLKEQEFGEALEMPDYFIYTEDLLFDGVLGLGLNKVASTGTPILYSLAQHQVIASHIFSFSLFKTAKERAEYIGDLVIGGIDDDRYTVPITWTPVTSDTTWEVQMKSVSIGQTKLCPGACRVMVNTSMAAIVGPQEQVDVLYKVLNAKPVGGLIVRSVLCNQMPFFPDLTFGVEGQTVKLRPVDYIIKEAIAGQEFCYLTIVALEDDKEDRWVLGATAHKPLYIVYDFGNSRMGFAQGV